MDTLTRNDSDVSEAILEDGVRDHVQRIQIRLAEMGEAITALRDRLEPVLNPNSSMLGVTPDEACVSRAPMVEHLEGLCATLTAQMWEVQEITRRVVL